MPLQADNLSTDTVTQDGNAQQLLSIAMPIGATMATDITILATDDTGSALYQGITALWINTAGVISLIGFTKQKGITNQTSKNWNVNATMDQVDQAVIITVQGTVGANIRWTLDGTYMTLQLGA